MIAHQASDTKARVARAIGQSTARWPFVDVFRGLLIAHMALDHASLMFFARRSGEELAAAPPPVFDGVLEFLTRFTGVPVAPGFFFMAGFMVALTSHARTQRGIAHRDVTRSLVTRGLVLLAADAIIMGLPRVLMGFYSFAVLSSIGAGLILLALTRELPNRVLLPSALAVFTLSPLLDLAFLPVAVRAVLYEPVRTGAVRSLYPILPWAAILVIGYVVGRDAIDRRRPWRLWIALSVASFVAFALVRLAGGYGNAYPYSSVMSLDFWLFAKYPPDLPFLAWSFAAIFLTLAGLWWIARERVPEVLRPLEIYGRVPFFFYIVHFYLLGLAASIVRAKFELPGTYAIWLLLLVVMIGPCVWYDRLKRERPNLITRYL